MTFHLRRAFILGASGTQRHSITKSKIHSLIKLNVSSGIKTNDNVSLACNNQPLEESRMNTGYSTKWQAYTDCFI